MSDAAPAPIQTFKSYFQWSVQRSAFNTPLDSHHFIKSKEFQPYPDSQVPWELRLYPRSKISSVRDYVGLYLGRLGAPVQTKNDPVRVIHRLGFIGSDGAEAHVGKWDLTFPKNQAPLPEWGWVEFIRRDMLFDPTRNFFRDDQLTIFCDLEVHLKLEVLVPECTLIHDWSALLESGDFSDVILVVGGEEIKAHKLVLSARSPVFATMFTHNMRENQTGRVEIPDLDVIAVKALLSFLYSGEVNDLEAIAEEVLPAADKYGVERLKSLCEKEIGKKLTTENVVDMLSLAELHSAKTLKALASAFINSNRAKVVEQPSFWDLAKSNQGNILLRGAFGFTEEEESEDSGEPKVKRRKLN